MVPNRAGDLVPVDSVSLTPILFNGAKQLRDPNKGYLLTETVNPIMNNQRQAGARNSKYKIICIENAETPSCTFYNLNEDPLEEYPLAKPQQLR